MIVNLPKYHKETPAQESQTNNFINSNVSP